AQRQVDGRSQTDHRSCRFAAALLWGKERAAEDRPPAARPSGRYGSPQLYERPVPLSQYLPEVKYWMCSRLPRLWTCGARYARCGASARCSVAFTSVGTNFFDSVIFLSFPSRGDRASLFSGRGTLPCPGAGSSGKGTVSLAGTHTKSVELLG